MKFSFLDNWLCAILIYFGIIVWYSGYFSLNVLNDNLSETILCFATYLLDTNPYEVFWMVPTIVATSIFCFFVFKKYLSIQVICHSIIFCYVTYRDNIGAVKYFLPILVGILMYFIYISSQQMAKYKLLIYFIPLVYIIAVFSEYNSMFSCYKMYEQYTYLDSPNIPRRKFVAKDGELDDLYVIYPSINELRLRVTCCHFREISKTIAKIGFDELKSDDITSEAIFACNGGKNSQDLIHVAVVPQKDVVVLSKYIDSGKNRWKVYEALRYDDDLNIEGYLLKTYKDVDFLSIGDFSFNRGTITNTFRENL